jgi:hypothetical protein
MLKSYHRANITTNSWHSRCRTLLAVGKADIDYISTRVSFSPVAEIGDLRARMSQLILDASARDPTDDCRDVIWDGPTQHGKAANDVAQIQVLSRLPCDDLSL